MLSATPGDTWSDYIPVFIANGFYRNKSDFTNKHIVYSRFTKYPKVEKYLNIGKLINLRQSILVNIDYVREVKRHHITVISDYDKGLYKNTLRQGRCFVCAGHAARPGFKIYRSVRR